MDILQKLTRFVSRVFKTDIGIFLEALKRSPNAQGYVSGSITELLLQQHLEGLGYEVRRIREKWEGRKHLNHHGDFYFRRLKAGHWYVLESKGVKSNSEKWHKLYNYGNLKGFLIAHADKLPWVDHRQNVEQQVVDWIDANLPRFKSEFASNLYEYEEVRNYKTTRVTPKSVAINALRGLTREQIHEQIESRLKYLLSRIRVLETHFVSGTSSAGARTMATPRKDEFNIVSVDIFLRFPEHKFLFANPNNLDSSGGDENHLQQNYIIGFVLIDQHGQETLSLTDEWHTDFDAVYATLTPARSVSEQDMQIDSRYAVEADLDEQSETPIISYDVPAT